MQLVKVKIMIDELLAGNVKFQNTIFKQKSGTDLPFINIITNAIPN